MKVTNKLGLPMALVNAVSVERHNKPGCYSATTLLKGVKETMLMERHHDELEQDAADSIWAIWGTAVHAIFEAQEDDTFKEEFFSTDVDGLQITGKVDCYDLEHELLVDWKTASVWKVQYRDFDDWHKQGLIYAWLMNKAGLKVSRCRFIAILKDHSKSKAKLDGSYPQKPVFTYEFDVTNEDLFDIENFIKQKVNSIKFNQNMSDDEIAECTPDERWADPAKFAVMKKGRKTALKLFDEENLASAFIELQPDKTVCYIEKRPSKSRKCSDYCACKEFCNFYKECVAPTEEKEEIGKVS